MQSVARLARSRPSVSTVPRAIATVPQRSINYLSVDSPYTGQEYTRVERATDASAQSNIAGAAKVFGSFRHSKLSERVQLCNKFLDAFATHKEAIAKDVTGQMGKPIKQALGEVDGMIARGRGLIPLAEQGLREEIVLSEGNAMKKITREPIGPVLALVPWNYPLLCTLNSVFHAVLSGCPVIIKHSDRSPLVADWFARIFSQVGAPAGLVQSVHADHALVARMIQHPDIAYVAFTGSVKGGHSVYKAVADRFIDVGLELGGKDAAYVCDDVDVKSAAAGVVDGALYNAGQSCCAVERIYVSRKLYEPFLQECVALAKEYVLEDPMSTNASLGPMAQKEAPSFLHNQVKQAKEKGARVLFGGAPTTDSKGKGRFFQPTVLADCNHSMSVMVEESFGPIVAVAPVDNDEAGIKLVNDSPYGLTASIWTKDRARAERLAAQCDVGTVYMNRCDSLDPALPWSGRRDSGKGIGLSHLGFHAFTRTKGYNFKF